MRGGVSNHSKAKRPLYGPHPTHTTNYTRMRVLGVGGHTDNRIDSYQRRQPQRTAHVVVSVVTATGKRPASIPNPEAKPDSADGTAPARVRESRTPPSTNHRSSPRGLHKGAPPGAEPIAGTLWISHPLATTSTQHQRTARSHARTSRIHTRTDIEARNGAPLSL